MGTGVLIISAAERTAIKAALERARAKPISLALIQQNAVEDKPVVNLADRKPDLIRPPSEHVMLGTYRAAVSFEQQPSGLCCHLSVSSAKPGRVPGPEVLQMVASEYGCTIDADGKLDAIMWMEEFDPGHYAVNMVWLVEQSSTKN